MHRTRNLFYGLTLSLLLVPTPATGRQVGDELLTPQHLAVSPLDLTQGWDGTGVQALMEAIGDARVVMLGEPWHGDGGAIRARAELVRILHEHMGFDVLAFEGDFYSLHLGWSQVRSPADAHALARENLYRFWGHSEAAQPLWNYIASTVGSPRPLNVAGVDIRHLGALARTTLPDSLDHRLARIPEVSADDREHFRAILERVLADEFTSRPPLESEERFLTTLDGLGRALAGLPEAEREPFWEQEVRNLRTLVLYAWRGANRDRGMGENLAWLATQVYPDRKIIVWSHNNHNITDKRMYFASPDPSLAANVANRGLEGIARFTYLGHEVRQFFGPSVYSLAVLSHQGRYTREIPLRNLHDPGRFDYLHELEPAPPGTIEARLSDDGYPMAFVDLRRSTPGPRTARGLDYAYSPPLQMRWEMGFDGFLFLHDTFGLDEAPPVGWPGASGW